MTLRLHRLRITSPAGLGVWFCASGRPRPPVCSGFTLMEMLLACGLMALLLGGAATTLAVANRSSARQGTLSQLDALIDQDLATIQALDRRFTCCVGSPCTATADTISAAATCRDAGGVYRSPGNENYYSPRQSQTPTAAQTAQWTTFSAACSNGTIGTTFQGLIAALPAASTAAGLSRTISTGTANSDQRLANRLQITYTGTIPNDNRAVITRVVNLVPIAANWCP